MPETDGLAATRRIREAEPPGQRVPIFALTASLARGTREQCLEAGMDEHLTKPLDIERFRTLLVRFLADARR
jgi:CheY-like chemotaxis protein